MLTSRSRGLIIALVAGALTLIGAGGATAKAPDQPQKGIAPLCLVPGRAPGVECTDGPIS
jgi:hypothetical protein